MKIYLTIMCIALMSILVILDQSLLFAETYQWTDTDGSIHFSDNPMTAPKGKQLIVRHPSLPLQNPPSTEPINNGQFADRIRRIEEKSNKAKKCNDTRQKIYRICGYPHNENWKCHMESMAELEAACNRPMQEETKNCAEATQKVIRICGNGEAANRKCFNDHLAGLDATCSGR